MQRSYGCGEEFLLILHPRCQTVWHFSSSLAFLPSEIPLFTRIVLQVKNRYSVTG
jgi:hypothetical protein